LIRGLVEPDPVLLMGRRGRWRLPWAIGGLALTGFLFVALTFAAGVFEDEATRAGWGGDVPDSVFPIDPAEPITYLFVLLACLPFLVAPLVALPLAHGLSWRRAFSFSGNFKWHQFGRAALAYLAVTAVAIAGGCLIEPQQYEFKPQTWSFAWWGLLALGVVFVQSLGEEVLFRGYLLRVAGAVLPYRVPVTAAVLALFVAGHLGNEDIDKDLTLNVGYFVIVEIISFGLLFRTQNLAASAGLHWMNNVAALFAPTVPGQPIALALIVYTDPVYASGGSRLFDLATHATGAAGVALLLILLFWRRSPLYLAPAASPGLKTDGAAAFGQAHAPQLPPAAS
jgi:membrane protease YdiL (CAAX protease family)